MMFAFKVVVHLAAIQFVWGAAGPKANPAVRPGCYWVNATDQAPLTVFGLNGKDLTEIAQLKMSDNPNGIQIFVCESFSHGGDEYVKILLPLNPGEKQPREGYVRATDVNDLMMMEFIPEEYDEDLHPMRDGFFHYMGTLWPLDGRPWYESLQECIVRLVLLPWFFCSSFLDKEDPAYKAMFYGTHGFADLIDHVVYGDLTDDNGEIIKVTMKHYLVAAAGAIGVAFIPFIAVWGLYRLIFSSGPSDGEDNATSSGAEDPDGILGTGFTLDDIKDNKEVVGLGAAALVGAGAFIAHKRGFCGNASSDDEDGGSGGSSSRNRSGGRGKGGGSSVWYWVIGIVVILVIVVVVVVMASGSKDPDIPYPNGMMRR